MPNFLVFAAILPRCFGKKIVLDVHDTLVETYASKFGGIMSKVIRAILVVEESVCCRLANSVICVNDIQRAALVERGVPESKMIVLMNLPDPKKFQASTQAFQKSGNGSLNIVYFGTITKRLGVDLAVRAVNELRDLASGVQFFIYGDGEGRDECRDLCRQLGIENLVHFSESTVPLDDLIQKVRGMDLVVVPNRSNAATDLMLPVKMLEGMALGIPVVAPRLRTIEHYFDADQVFYFEPEDVHSLAGAILRAYRDGDERRRKTKNAGRFFDTYSWERQRKELYALYSGMV
jgi:glycosyltransferase involved in cell wall biosynthesis